MRAVIFKERLFLRKRKLGGQWLCLEVKLRPFPPPAWEATRLALSLHRDQPPGGAEFLEAEPRQLVAFLNSSEGGGRARAGVEGDSIGPGRARARQSEGLAPPEAKGPRHTQAGVQHRTSPQYVFFSRTKRGAEAMARSRTRRGSFQRSWW